METVLITGQSLIPATADDVFSIGVRHTYIDAMGDYGLAPIIVGSHMKKEIITTLYRLSSAIIFTGGTDWNPTLYDQVSDIHTQSPDTERDEMELALFEKALDDRKPVLGICRGAQGIAIAVGKYWGIEPKEPILIQHLPDVFLTGQQHIVSSYKYHFTYRHSVEIVEGTLAYEVFSKRYIEVSSGHHQAVNENALENIPVLLASGFSVSDKVVEIIEMKRDQHPFCMGMQAHPEAVPDISAPLFRRLSIEAQKYNDRH